MMGVADPESTKTVKLYLRLPVKIIDEKQVKDLHPGIIKVNLPRQKSRRWCIVDFVGESKELKAVKIDGKKLHVKSHKIKKNH